MKLKFPAHVTVVALVFLAAGPAPVIAQEEINITGTVVVDGWPAPIPVNISGFAPEADAVLKQDLTFMGFKFVSADDAKFLINGGNAGRIEGRVVEKFNKQQLLAKAYAGGSTRSQVHALADDITLAITGKPGIAQTKIAFKVEPGVRSADGSYIGEIYIADYDGFNAQAVTQDRAIVAAPTWLGKRTLYYVSYKLGPCHVFSHELTTGARRAVTRSAGSNMSPAVSPDGRRLAMILSKSGNPELYVGDPEGEGLKQLTNTREPKSSPCWSPDGQQICYVSRDRGPASLYAISASGGAARRIVTAGVGNATEPDWSPDGKWIVFTTQRARTFDLCLVKPEGGEAKALVEGEDPSWAPNSRAVIFSKGPDHSKVLSLLDVPTKRIKTIARISSSNSQPSWAK